MYATDTTVCMRRHRDGSMTILNKDATVVLDHLAKAQVRKAITESEREARGEMRGILLGMALGLVMWGALFLVAWACWR